jgi:hypothetical protein
MQHITGTARFKLRIPILEDAFDAQNKEVSDLLY